MCLIDAGLFGGVFLEGVLAVVHAVASHTAPVAARSGRVGASAARSTSISFVHSSKHHGKEVVHGVGAGGGAAASGGVGRERQPTVVIALLGQGAEEAEGGAKDGSTEGPVPPPRGANASRTDASSPSRGAHHSGALLSTARSSDFCTITKV